MTVRPGRRRATTFAGVLVIGVAGIALWNGSGLGTANSNPACDPGESDLLAGITGVVESGEPDVLLLARDPTATVIGICTPELVASAPRIHDASGILDPVGGFALAADGAAEMAQYLIYPPTASDQVEISFADRPTMNVRFPELANEQCPSREVSEQVELIACGWLVHAIWHTDVRSTAGEPDLVDLVAAISGSPVGAYVYRFSSGNEGLDIEFAVHTHPSAQVVIQIDTLQADLELLPWDGVGELMLYAQ